MASERTETILAAVQTSCRKCLCVSILCMLLRKWAVWRGARSGLSCLGIRQAVFAITKVSSWRILDLPARKISLGSDRVAFRMHCEPVPPRAYYPTAQAATRYLVPPPATWRLIHRHGLADGSGDFSENRWAEACGLRSQRTLQLVNSAGLIRRNAIGLPCRDPLVGFLGA